MFSKQMYANTSASAVPAPCKISEVRKKKAITRKKTSIVKKVNKMIAGGRSRSKSIKRKQGAILKKQFKINDFSQ